jgi:hypothetical protein
MVFLHKKPKKKLKSAIFFFISLVTDPILPHISYVASEKTNTTVTENPVNQNGKWQLQIHSNISGVKKS